MSALQFLLTACSIFTLGLCAFFAWQAKDAAANARHSEHRLAVMRGQVAGMEAALAGLDAKHQKLAGRVYADEYWRGKRDEQPELQPLDPTTFRNLPECENWRTAQRDGPSSPAAGCECAYCNERRADRAARRAKLRTGVKS